MTSTKKTKKNTAPAPAAASNKAKALELLRRESGASLDEVVEVTGWLPHSARAVFTGLRKNGFGIERRKVEGVTRYALTAEPAA